MSDVVLWQASSPRPVDRKTALDLWRGGRVSGLFNLSTREQFDACQDLCVEARPGARADAAGPQGPSLQQRLEDASAQALLLREELDAARRRERTAVRAAQQEAAQARARAQALGERLARANSDRSALEEQLAFVYLFIFFFTFFFQ